VNLRSQHLDCLHGREFLDAILRHILERAPEALDIGHANLSSAACLLSSRFAVDDVSPTAERQLTLHNPVVNVISQTRSEYGGQDIEGVSVVI
jgi:hypothetical protein